MEKARKSVADLINCKPNDIIFITAGVDVQKDRLEVEFKGWGIGYENWGIEHLKIWGETQETSVWEKLYRELKKPFYKKDGTKMNTTIALIDSGYNKDRVYSFVKLDKRFFATKGASEQEKKKEFVNKPKIEAAGVGLFSIGTFAGKSEIFRLLSIKDKGAGYCHYPQSYTLDYFKQLTAEKLVKKRSKNGYEMLSFENTKGARNEALDLSVLCLAGAKILKLDRLDFKNFDANKGS